jgi:hypothetical protein
MRPRRSDTLRARAIVALLAGLTWVPAGCAPVWHETDVRAAVAEQPDSIRATTVSGTTWVLAAPRISADSLVGFTWEKGEGGARLAIPTPSLSKVERYDETGRWLSLGALLLATTVLALSSDG